MEAAPRLKVIVTPTTGLNHIDLCEANRRGITILSLKGEIEFLRNMRATAEYTVGLMLALLRAIPAASAHVQRGGWNRDLFKGYELYGKTVGVVGYGRVGRLVGRYLLAFDARVIAADPTLSSEQVAPHVELMPFEDLLREADIVTLHVNYTPEKHAFFGAKQFAQMRPGSWFINTSRGELVDKNALLNALVSGHLAGAALDVVANECSRPMPDRPLIRYAARSRNLLITLHLAGNSYESSEKTEIFMAQNLRRYLELTMGPRKKSSAP